MTTQAQHTPGPWHVQDNTYQGEHGQLRVDSMTCGAVATCGRGATMSDQLLANAHLIAAAPDLLAALRDVAALLPCGARLHPDDLFALQTRVVAALAKVTP